MIVICKTFFRVQLVSLAACLALSAQLCAQAGPVNDFAGVEQSINTHIKGGEYASAERLVRSELHKLDGADESLDSMSPAGGKEPTYRQKLQSALATVLGARAFEADQRMGTRLTGSDFILLLAAFLLAAGLLVTLLRYGPLRPKLVDETTRWLEKIKQENNEDTMKQCTSVMYTLGVFVVAGGAIFLFLYGTIHLVANLDSYENTHSKEARALFDEAKVLLAESTSSPDAVEDYDVLNLYSRFLHRMGEHDLASAVTRRAVTLQKRFARCGRVRGSS